MSIVDRIKTSFVNVNNLDINNVSDLITQYAGLHYVYDRCVPSFMLEICDEDGTMLFSLQVF